MDWPSVLARCFAAESVLYSRHAREEMRTEELGRITDAEVAQAVAACETLEEYPDDRPYPSALVLGTTACDRPIHMVCAYDGEDDLVVVVTVYRPDPDRWEDSRRRKPSS